MDTGIDYEHEELAGRMWTEPEGFKLKGFHGMDFVDNDEDPMDENGHGTHCSGIIAAEANNSKGISGVAGGSGRIQLMSARILDADGSGDLQSIITAFNYLIRVRKAGVNLRAINCSFGASVSSEIFDAVIDKAGEAGILTIAAAGNDAANNDDTPSAPANSKSNYVISVAALDDNGKASSYTNYGRRNVDVAAPGSNILSPVCYDNYAPYLYTASQLAKNTQYYGEFGGSKITEKTEADGSTYQAVTPVSGTDYDGKAITGIDGFGESVSISDLTSESSGKATIELTDDNAFPIGNNKTSLRWKIAGAKEGDQYVLYFPYEKMATGSDDTYMSMVVRTHTDKNGGTGALDVGDVIAYVDKNGKLSYQTVASEDFFGMLLPVSEDWNSIWQASGTLGALFPHSAIKGVSNNMASISAVNGNVDTGKSADEEDSETSDKANINAGSDAGNETSDNAGINNNESAGSNEEGAAAEEIELDTETSTGNNSANSVIENNSAVILDAETSGNGIAANMAAEVESTSSNDGGQGSHESTAIDGNAGAADEMSGYGLGMVYTAESDGDVYVDISSIAISRVGADESTFGKYDVYSGTSMATPVVTGSAALIAAMNPNFDAEQIRDILFQSTRGGYEDICSTGGAVDFARYTKADMKPAISDAKVDFENKTVTLSGSGLGTSPKISVKWGYQDKTADIAAVDIGLDKNGRLVISDKYGLIGSDVTFTVTNDGGQSGQRTFYLVSGLEEYDKLFRMDKAQEEFDLLDWSKGRLAGSKVKSGKAGSSDDEEDDEDEGSTAFLDGVTYLKGCNELYLYDESGMYMMFVDEEEGIAGVEEVGERIYEGVDRYVTEAAKKNELWAPDDPEEFKELRDKAEKEGDDPAQISYYTMDVAADPVYLDNNVYEIIRVDLTDREAYLLIGMDLGRDKPEWTVYYDSLADFGEAPKDLKFGKLASMTLAARDGRLYLIGLSETRKNDDDLNIVTTYTCEPSADGTKWEKSADLAGATANGKAIGFGNDLYYFLGTDQKGEIDYNMYKFDGSKWSVAGTLPQALYIGSDGEIDLLALLFGLETDTAKTVPCAYGIDNKGIVIAGTSFDSAGDTFRFNPKTGKTEQLGYTLWGNVTDRAVDGTVTNGRLIAQYDIKDGEKVEAKSIDLENGYATVDVTVTGKGSGAVRGGGSHPVGAKTNISVTPAKGSYIYEIHTKGLAKNLNKKYGKSTKASRAAFSTTFGGKGTATVSVHFGKVSTKVTIKKIKTVKVGKRKLKASTDGTISGVKWKSSNKKYAKVLKNGKIQFKKAGIGKTVTLTAISKENPKLKAKIKVKIKKK